MRCMVGLVDVALQLVEDAVSVVDVLAPPDNVLRAPIGLSNGQVCVWCVCGCGCGCDIIIIMLYCIIGI